jgi:hypothetical protein
MNASDDERFRELAPKAIAKRADARELADLQTMLQEHPNLKQEFEMMKVEVALLKEALPLFEDIEHREVAIPDVPLERLRDKVRGVSVQRSRTGARLGRLLSQLGELVTSGGSEAERERRVALVAALEEFLTRADTLEPKTEAPEPKTEQPEVKTSALEPKTEAPAEDISKSSPIEAGRFAWKAAREKAGGAEAELQHKLMTMEGRLTNALTHLNNCKDEALTLLDLIREEKNALGRKIAEKIAEKREKGG